MQLLNGLIHGIMAKFKHGQVIEAIERGRGFGRATVLYTFTSQEKRYKGREMYMLKIMNGTATIPVEAEVCYKVVKGAKK